MFLNDLVLVCKDIKSRHEGIITICSKKFFLARVIQCVIQTNLSIYGNMYEEMYKKLSKCV